MQIQLEDLLHASSGLPAPTWAEMLQHLFLFFQPHFADASIKREKKSQSEHHTTCILHFSCLGATSSRTSGQGGREQAQGRDGRKTGHTEEIKTQTKKHNRQDQQQKRQIQETGICELDRWSDARSPYMTVGFSRYYDALVPIQMAVTWMPSLCLSIYLCWNQAMAAPSPGQQAAFQNSMIACKSIWQMGRAGFGCRDLHHSCLLLTVQCINGSRPPWVYLLFSNHIALRNKQQSACSAKVWKRLCEAQKREPEEDRLDPSMMQGTSSQAALRIAFTRPTSLRCIREMVWFQLCKAGVHLSRCKCQNRS